MAHSSSMTLSATRLDRIQLSNFRLFGSLDVELHPRLNVIVALNGGGKTALLDAIALGWAAFVHPLEGRVQAQGILSSDVRRQRASDETMEALTPAVVQMSAHIDGHPFAWDRALLSGRPRARTRGGLEVRRYANFLREQTHAFAKDKTIAPPILPVFAYYGTGRLWDVLRLRRKGSQEGPRNSRFDGYHSALSSSSHARTFADWFKRFSRQAMRDSMSQTPSPHLAIERLQAVREAVNALLEPSAWGDIEWDEVNEAIYANHPENGRLPVNLLSDGIRNMIGLVADLAHRAARLNPQLGVRAALDTPGVVLIDEVDMHLHPEWQQTVIESLAAAFPRVQFIVSTHSPQVLSTVERESIRVLHVEPNGEARAAAPGFQTRGVESTDVLAQVMGVDPTPALPEAQWVSDYKVMILEGKGESREALVLRKKIEEHFDTNHPVVVDCKRMLRFQAFKRSRKPSGEDDAKD